MTGCLAQAAGTDELVVEPCDAGATGNQPWFVNGEWLEGFGGCLGVDGECFGVGASGGKTVLVAGSKCLALERVQNEDGAEDEDAELVFKAVNSTESCLEVETSLVMPFLLRADSGERGGRPAGAAAVEQTVPQGGWPRPQTTPLRSCGWSGRALWRRRAASAWWPTWPRAGWPRCCAGRGWAITRPTWA